MCARACFQALVSPGQQLHLRQGTFVCCTPCLLLEIIPCLLSQIPDTDMDAMFKMLEAHLPEEDKPIQQYMHEGDTSLGCHCTLFDYHQVRCAARIRISPHFLRKKVRKKKRARKNVSRQAHCCDCPG